MLNRKSQIKMRRKKNVKKGIQFCLMVCGASGTGTACSSGIVEKLLLNPSQSQDVLPLSILYVENVFYRAKTPTMIQSVLT